MSHAVLALAHAPCHLAAGLDPDRDMSFVVAGEIERFPGNGFLALKDTIKTRGRS